MSVMHATNCRAFSRLVFAFLQLILYLDISLSRADPAAETFQAGGAGARHTAGTGTHARLTRFDEKTV